ncbi:hypothetical protein STRPS_1549 [Streptococcus pseudoporcinus LQ 940-04]|uniref:Uncharacterized protein n=1 Tax=Streptococcus pseudoporcinus LQ 940-04 TaxID=875093 RepID=G5KB30_9STRE|nr:hypothetical protein HMPREF9320_0219 [Streptococcus pseudoporcinus SPIN 20026]EHI65306.1 hypothetical protein STRPS_1549 [Streptococcus pseudoporcinus LQ 940-04]
MKKILFGAARDLDKKENLYILADYLLRFVTIAIRALGKDSPKALIDLYQYLLDL